MKLVGIDRAQGVWLVVESDERLRGLTLGIVEDLTDYLSSLDATDAQVVVDIPIGLPASMPRRVDRAARKVVGPKRTSSIFPVPMRAALAGRTYDEASAFNYAACGKKLSKQAYAILDGIRELDEFMTPQRQGWLREGHPEVTFAMLSGGVGGVVEPKKSGEGFSIRRELLETQFPVPDIDRARLELGRGNAGRDDILDGLAMLVSARRLRTGEALILPEDGPEIDERGLRMEMVA